MSLILCTRMATDSWIGQCMHTPAGRRSQPRHLSPILDPLYVIQITLPVASGKKQTLTSKLAEQAGMKMGDGKIPAKYQHHAQVFSKEASKWFPEPHIWDHTIKLKPGAPSSIPGKVYQLMQDEQKALLKSMQEQQEKGYIHPSKSPYAAPFFFIKKKDGKLHPVQDYRWLNEWTIHNHYPIPLVSELIAKVQGVKLFTSINLQQGYNNVHIKKGDEWKVVFITNHAWAVQTHCHVFQANKLTSNLSNHDECDLCQGNHRRVANSLHGQHPYHHKRWPPIPWEVCPQDAWKTQKAQPLPQTGEMHL